MQHKHKDAIIAWAEGKPIAYRIGKDKPWVITPSPRWDTPDQNIEYREVKAEELSEMLERELKFLASHEGLTTGVGVRQLAVERAVHLFQKIQGK